MKRCSVAGFGLGAALVAMWLAQGCAGGDCANVGCGPTVHIAFEPALEPVGSYEFVLRPEGGEAITCMAIASDRSNSDVCVASSDKTQRPDIIRQREGSRIEGLQLWGEAPRSLEILVYHDRQELSRKTHRLDYDTDYPAGEACGGCQSASVRVDF